MSSPNGGTSEVESGDISSAASRRTTPKSEKIESFDFAMMRGGVITGKVVDPEGRPAIEEPISVFALPSNERAHVRPRFNTTTIPMASSVASAANAAAFSNAGHSRGLNYNIFCSGNVALADGRLLFVGGHDKGGNNGIRKLNIFDPSTETWVARPMPRVKADFLADPTGLSSPHADPLNEVNTDPPLPSDMKYQRWYPSAVTLPDGRVLILSGTDQDSSVGPGSAALTKRRIVTPDLYDPETDRTIALENARLFQETQRRAQETAALAEVGREISATLNLETVLTRIAIYARDLFQAESSAVYLPEPDGASWQAIAVVGAEDGLFPLAEDVRFLRLLEFLLLYLADVRLFKIVPCHGRAGGPEGRQHI